MRKLLIPILSLALVLTGCTTSGAGDPPEPSTTPSDTAPEVGFPADAVIGVTLPQKTSESWVPAEWMFNDGLTDAGFKPKVALADGGVTEQQAQVLAMIQADVKVIIIKGYSGEYLDDQLAAAKQAGIPVIAYERLLTATRALIAKTIDFVKQLQQGQDIAFTDTIDNGVKLVPTYLLQPVTVTKDNVCTAYDPDSWAGEAAAETPFCKGE